MWPLVAEDLGHRVDRPFLTRGHLTTCSSGGFEKFELTHYHREQIPYAYRYEKLVPHILKASGGTHIHIGTLSERMLSIIRRGLDELAVSHDRFIHIEYVPNLWAALLDLSVDAYVGSFPLGGGRATIEAMGADSRSSFTRTTDRTSSAFSSRCTRARRSGETTRNSSMPWLHLLRPTRCKSMRGRPVHTTRTIIRSGCFRKECPGAPRPYLRNPTTTSRKSRVSWMNMSIS